MSLEGFGYHFSPYHLWIQLKSQAVMTLQYTTEGFQKKMVTALATSKKTETNPVRESYSTVHPHIHVNIC